MPSDDILIRAPRIEEYAACRMLLPPLPRAPAGEYLLAVQEQRPFIVGAACLVRSAHIVHGVRVHVIPPFRRQGAGSKLLQHVIGIADGQRSGVSVTLDALGEPQGEPFLLHHGFRRVGQLTTVETAVDTARATLLPIADRLLQRERASGDRKIVRLSDAPLPAVTALYLQELARNPATAPWALLDQISTPQFAGSPVFMVGNRVAGLMLFLVEGDLGSIPARIVAPEFQGGAVNLLLMADALRRSHEYTATRVQFDIPAENRDTESLARRLSATPVRIREAYFRDRDSAQ